ncbi:MAG: hypothetical protein PHI32_06640 [Dysgonamonadaceae bacterium]|nr:hypothetical protein [Dysgonamonadaceae bacterium]MDD4729372.1 hypothetical protein [Dysgonamonadaceae bacterium]
MALFNHKIRLVDIIREIPDAELTRLAKETRVDYCTKVLNGKLMFYLLLYGMLKINRMSQRGLADAFSSPMFRMIFDTGDKKEISHSSISERLSVIELDFFTLAYDCIYKRFNSLYSKKEIAKMSLERVDSTLVAEASNKLLQGMTCGNEYKKKKMLKYTIAFDGMFASFPQIHSQEKYANESLAIPENVINHCKQTKDHAKVYLFDRGVVSGCKFVEMKNTDNLLFIGRLVENRKLKIVEERSLEEVDFSCGDLLRDDLVQIYGSSNTLNSKGNVVRKLELLDETFRVVRFKPIKAKEDILLITNADSLPADTIAEMYKRRSDIEVFSFSQTRIKL